MVSDSSKPNNGCLQTECTLAKFGLDYGRPTDFMQSQWKMSQVFFVAYRTFFAIYWFVWLIITNAINNGWASTSSNMVKTLIYLTTWTHIMMSLSAIFQAAVAIDYYRKNRNGERPSDLKMNIALRTTWVLYNISSAGAIVVTIFYYGFVFDSTKEWTVTDVHIHLLNSVYVLLDVWIIAIPVRVQHFYQPLTYGTVYGLFSYFYFLAGGTNALDYGYIYAALDWSKPGHAFGNFALAAFVGLPSTFLLLFAMFKLRRYIYERVSDSGPIDDEESLYQPEQEGADTPMRKQAPAAVDYGSTGAGDT